MFDVGEKELNLKHWFAITGEGESWLTKATSVFESLGEMLVNIKPGTWTLAIEEPIYSWGRKNPKAFSKTTSFMATIIYCAHDRGVKGIRIVNPKAMKLIYAGNGKVDKDGIIAKTKSFLANKNRSQLIWPSRKSSREAVADATGIGYAAWQHILRGSITGVELFYGE